MTTDSSPDLLSRYRAGDASAANEIFRRYRDRLCALARKLLDKRVSRRVSASDVVQLVFVSFFRRAEIGQFVAPASDDLWRLLCGITANKVRAENRRHRQQKRNVAREVGTEVASDRSIDPAFLAHDPTPDEALALTEEIIAVRTALDPSDQLVFDLILGGMSCQAVADQLECSRWKVRRSLNQIERRLLERFEQNRTG